MQVPIQQQEHPLVITRIWKLISLVALVGVVAGAEAEDSRATKYLVRSLKGEYQTNVVAILRRFSGDRGNGEKTTMVVKIEKSRDGKTHESVLSPLHLQSEFLNDGKKLQTYSIDDKVMIVQPVSPIDQEFNFRWPLIQKNYTLKSEPGKPIAGRNCVIVTASSKYSQLPDIRYYFDEKTGFPLSTETVRTDGSRSTQYEVTSVQFPPKLDASIFKIDPIVGVEVINYAEPQSVSGPNEAAQTLGFMPIIPPKMPLGFQMHKMTISSKGKVKMLCLKLTDGLQRVTVYEWVPMAGETIKTGEDRVIRLHNGIKIVVVSDIDSSVRDTIIRTFLVRGERDEPPMITSIGFSRNSYP